MGQGVEFVKYLTVTGVDPVDPAAGIPAGLDLVEVVAGVGIDHQIDQAVAGRADIAGDDTPGRGRGQVDVVASDDSRVVGTDDESDLTSSVPVESQLSTQDLGGRVTEELLVALVGQADASCRTR